MRTMGDMNWLNDYIGMPYVPGGRDMTGVDCYGLARLVYAQEYGMHLPDWMTDNLQLREYNDMITGVVTGGDFTEMEEPHDGGFVVCYRTKMAHHIGLFYGGGVLHAETGIGTIYEPMSRFKERYKQLKFGEWQPT